MNFRLCVDDEKQQPHSGLVSKREDNNGTLLFSLTLGQVFSLVMPMNNGGEG